MPYQFSVLCFRLRKESNAWRHIHNVDSGILVFTTVLASLEIYNDIVWLVGLPHKNWVYRSDSEDELDRLTRTFEAQAHEDCVKVLEAKAQAKRKTVRNMRETREEGLQAPISENTKCDMPQPTSPKIFKIKIWLSFWHFILVHILPHPCLSNDQRSSKFGTDLHNFWKLSLDNTDIFWVSILTVHLVIPGFPAWLLLLSQAPLCQTKF